MTIGSYESTFQLESLPESMSGLSELLVVLLSGNKLSAVPDLSASKDKLTELTANDNAFEVKTCRLSEP